MRYGILPTKPINDAYVCRFNSLNEAQTAAEQLCLKYQTEVQVIEVHGVITLSTLWTATPPVLT